MRLVTVMVLAGLVALPLSAGAQAGEVAAPSEENLQEPAPSAEPAGEEARASDEHSLSFWHDEALKIALFSAPPRTSVEAKSPAVIEAERRVKRARIALGVSVVPLVLGTGLAVAGAFRELDFTTPPSDTSGQDATLYAGSAIVGAGAVWMITSGIVLGVRKRQLRELQQAHYGTRRRVHWDLARSRLVF